MHTVSNNNPSKSEEKQVNPLTIIAVCEEKDMDGNTNQRLCNRASKRKGARKMYDIPYHIENEYLTPPENEESSEKCSYCHDPIFYGEECLYVGRNKEYIFCQHCTENESYTEILEKESEFEYAI